MKPTPEMMQRARELWKRSRTVRREPEAPQGQPDLVNDEQSARTREGAEEGIFAGPGCNPRRKVDSDRPLARLQASRLPQKDGQS